MNTATALLAAIILLSSTELASPAKILLLYPIPYPSHWKAFKPLFEELAKRGHQITAYTTLPGLKSFKNFEHIAISADTSKVDVMGFDPVGCRSKTLISYLYGLWGYFSAINEAALESKELQALMHSDEKFDLLMTEANFMEESILGFSHKFNVPVVSMYPIFITPWMAQLAGIPHSYSYIPSTLQPFTDQMSFWQRTVNTITGLSEILLGHLHHLPSQERMMRKHFKYPGSENIPPVGELIANISLHLIDSHQIMSFVRPYPPHVIDVAGMNTKSAGKLPQDLQTFLDDAKDGFIYVCFGSFINKKAFSRRFENVLTETLRGLKWKVIMKSSDEIEGAPHIMTRPWLPQVEILSHPNCKLFVTHGGFNSLMEVMSIGVPTLGLPFFSDQFQNVAWYEHKGVGLKIDYDTATVADLTEKINKIINTPSFMDNAKQIAKLYHDEPQSRLANAVFWVEYVIRHKGAHHLKPESVRMPYYQYLLLDVIAFLVAVLFLATYIAYYLAQKFLRSFLSTNNALNVKKRN
nr:PREDICTED: UDP-glucuronosyltransferase 2B31-like [Bemisia tabaci]XP_018905659.1 PREDICTED: UDP-glucuronosyltransferase 2B31-like [Bemisia tabaci]XP_018905660.1 PREDICTED: UDP-glucuronosyltransferase 2B31-like [Bemisia tabaci]